MCGISSDAEALQRDPRGRAGGERRADPLTREPAMEVVREQLERNDAKRRLADWWNRRRARDNPHHPRLCPEPHFEPASLVPGEPAIAQSATGMCGAMRKPMARHPTTG